MAISLKQDLETIDNDSSLVEAVSTRLMVQTKAAKEFLRIALANALLMDRKQHDYGPENIGDFREFGVVVRMNDKMKRIKHLFGQGKRRRAKNEPLEDSFRDISNYGIIALMCMLDRWPSE